MRASAHPAPTRDEDEKLLNQAEAAELLHVSPKTLERWRWSGEGPPYFKLSDGKGAVRYGRRRLLAWLEGRDRDSTSDTGRPQPVAQNG